MRVLAFLAVLAVLVVTAVPSNAGVKVDYEIGVDFDNYTTYAWQPGEEAGNPQVQQWILRAVERELASAGLKKVDSSRADLFVVTQAGSTMDASASGGYVRLDQYDVGVLTQGVVVETRGYLAVDLIDARTERGVWRGLANEVMGLPSMEKLKRKVDKVTRKMFKSFPPR
jgi:hypothetical protein